MTKTWADWTRELLPHVAKPGARVLIDGRSGSGKSTLAEHLEAAAAEHGTPVQCVHLEDIYPGWDGLEAAAGIVANEILPQLAATGRASWPTWDWYADRPGAEMTADSESPLIIEGAGALTRASAPMATYSIWVEAAEDVRQARAFARDGDLYRPHWQRWAEQEDVLLAREDSPALADIVID